MKDSITYAALVLQVELYRGGELVHGTSRTLSNRGWSLKTDEGVDERASEAAQAAACRSLCSGSSWRLRWRNELGIDRSQTG